MSTSITFPLPDGATYIIPAVDDENWGQNVTNFLVSIPNGVPPRSGTFALTGDLSFGPSFGLKSKYLTSLTSTPSLTGMLRLAKTDAIAWRNNGNSGDLLLAVNGSDNLTFGGTPVTVGGVTSIVGTANQVIASVPTGTVTLSLPQDIAPASTPVFAGVTLTSTLALDRGIHFINIDTPVALATNYTLTLPLLQGGAGTFLQNDGSGVLSWASAGAGGVSSITGTANEIIASSSTGAITLSTPQAIGTGSSPTFAAMILTSGSTPHLNVVGTGVTAAQLLLEANSLSNNFSTDSTGDFSLTDVDNSRTLIAYSRSANTVKIHNLVPIIGTPAGTGTITPDASTANQFNITVSGTLTINGPSNPSDGQKVTLRVLNDASHTVTLATGAGNFRFGTDIASYANSVSLTDYIGAIYNSAATRWDIVSVIQGF